MPVRSKPSSEYVKKFRWNDSVKSSSFTPTKAQKAPEAGLSSVDFAETFAVTREPALQRRRKPILIDNKLTYTTRQFVGGGDSEESSDIGKPSRMAGTTFAKTFVKRDDTTPKRKQPMEKDVKTLKNKAIAAQTRVVSKPSRPPAPAVKAPPPAPTRAAKGPSLTRTEKPVRAGGDAATKGTAKAQPETNEALMYRAGVRAKPGGPRYSSEYQRQFAWKQPSSKESPLMAAEQMVHSSNANLAPYVPDKMSRHSEYQRQFKQQNPVGPSVKEQLMQNAEHEIKAKYRLKTKSKKGKKLTPDRLQAAGVPSITAHDDPRSVKASQNPQRPFFPHATVRKWRSEYKSNYKTPQIFSYENGVWKGADPPQVEPRDDSSDTGKPEQLSRSKSVGDLPNWFAEVLELRERAQEYQKRSRGTHFSRDHLAQLLANQARMWEEQSTASSTQTSGSEKKDEQEKEKIAPVTDSGDKSSAYEISPVRRKLAWPTNGDVQHDTNQNENNAQRRSSSSSFATLESLGATSSLSSEMESIDENGRLPTPTLRETRPSHGTKRHHLDRTTPARGGALLTSPASQRRAAARVPQTTITYPRQAEHMKPSSHTYVAKSAPAKAIIPGGISKGFEYDSDADDDSDGELDRTLTDVQRTPPRNRAQQKQLTRFNQTSPSAGRKTFDPHPINEELSLPNFQRHSERFFETSPGMPSIPNKIEPPKTWAAPRQDVRTTASARGPLERPHSGSIAGRPQTAVPQTRHQASHQEQRVNSFMSPRSNGADDVGRESPDDWDLTPLGRGRRDSDELSLSAISNASSCSLASEVLERAKKRRDDFWGKEKRD